MNEKLVKLQCLCLFTQTLEFRQLYSTNIKRLTPLHKRKSYLSLTSLRSELMQNANHTLQLLVVISEKRHSTEFQPQEATEKVHEGRKERNYSGRTIDAAVRHKE